MQCRGGKVLFRLRNKGQNQGADLTLLHSFLTKTAYHNSLNFAGMHLCLFIVIDADEN